MKAIELNGVYQVEPETDREKAALDSIIETYSRKTTTGDCSPAIHSHPSGLDHSKAASG